MESAGECLEVTAFDAVTSTSYLEALDPSPSGLQSEVATDFGIENESTAQQPLKLQGHRGRGRPRRKASNMSQKEVAEMGSKRQLRTRKNADVASEDPWTNLSNAPLIKSLNPKKNDQALALQKSQPPVNWKLLPLHSFY
jgi:hypothetical protein